MKSLKTAKFAALITVLIILSLTVLEFPAPIGFEARPQEGVSMYWLILFMAILLSELAMIPLIFKRPNFGAKLGMLAGVLNLVQIIADQAHLMQPESAPIAYLLLEDLVGFFSIVLIYFCSRLIALAYVDVR
jgi:hypothetical protein